MQGPGSKSTRRALILITALSCAALAGVGSARGNARHLVACADPNNLPFSNRAGEGFENRIAALVARDLHASLSYVWWAQRRGYVRSTLNESRCDIWPGVAAGTDRVVSSRPYYRSTYMFVTRSSAPLAHLTLDDPRLRSALIGVQMIGNDSMNSPPAHAIASRGMTDNVRGYMLYGDYRSPNPPAEIVGAVARKEIDVALVWGPLAGYFAHRSRIPLRLDPVTPDDPPWKMAFDISMGIRRGDAGLAQEINGILERESRAIERILARYDVPLAPRGAAPGS